MLFIKPKTQKILIEEYSWDINESTSEPIVVKLRRSSQSRAVRILVSRRGDITVTGPRRISKKVLIQALEKNREWVLATRREFQKSERRDKKLSPKEYRAKQKLATILVMKKLVYWNQFYGYRYGKVTIRNQVTRWGSCSGKGNLSFHYRILELPEDLADYLIVHELCHLEAFHHRQTFWRLVEKTLPDYEARRKALREWEL